MINHNFIYKFQIIIGLIFLTSCTNSLSKLHYNYNTKNKQSILQLDLKQEKFFISIKDSVNTFLSSGSITKSVDNEYWTLEFPENSQNKGLTPFKSNYYIIDTLGFSEQIEIELSTFESNTKRPLYLPIMLVSNDTSKKTNVYETFTEDIPITFQHKLTFPKSYEGYI